MRFNSWTWLGLWLVAVGWIVFPFGGVLLEAAGQADSLRLLPPHLLQALPTIATQLLVCGFAIALISLIVEAARQRDRSPGESEAAELVLVRSGEAAGPAAPRARVVRFGILRERPYVMFEDGSLVVGTLLGVRSFGALAEAVAFVGGDNQAPAGLVRVPRLPEAA